MQQSFIMNEPVQFYYSLGPIPSYKLNCWNNAIKLKITIQLNLDLNEELIFKLLQEYMTV